MDARVVAGVETSAPLDPPEPGVRIRLLGPLTVSRKGESLTLPASRKARALLAYLALAPRPVSRGHLCELLWDGPHDPRGELRWCLSKIRGVIDDTARHRVIAHDDAISLDLTDCAVDAIEVARAMQTGVALLSATRARALVASVAGDFLDGLDVERSANFTGWLVAQRRQFRSAHAALLEHLSTTLPDAQALPYIDTWLQLAPFDMQAHRRLLRVLAGLGRINDGERHLACTIAQFDAEGLSAARLPRDWQEARAQAFTAPAAGSAPSFSPDPLRPSEADRGRALAATRRASVAMMPLHDLSADAAAGRHGMADALAHDVITRLAKLRSLFVIAQGTVQALHQRHIGAEQAGRMLDVDYVISGTLRRDGARLTVSVELVETRTARIVWTEVFAQTLDDVFQVLDEIGNRIVACVASEIEMVERNRAILKPPNSLDAWEAHHRGLWHMYRFNPADNERARHFFALAVRLDPSFARAYAGLSFTHFQNAFQGWAEREPDMDQAMEAARQSLLADERDPAASWAMGRALWLRGRHDEAVTELQRSIELSPNFAQGHYSLAFVQAQAGDAQAAIASSDHSRMLSPFDPLLFGMLGARAIALVRLGQFDTAADWAVKAAGRPNAHPHIFGIAAYSLALAGRLDEARTHAQAICRLHPAYRLADFLAAFRLDADGAARFRKGAERIGMA